MNWPLPRGRPFFYAFARSVLELQGIQSPRGAGRWGSDLDVKRLALICLAAVAALGAVTACSKKPAEAPAAPAAPVVERSGPIAWNGSGFTVAGQMVKTAKVWTFDGATDGFSALSTKLTPAVGSGLSVVVGDPAIRSPKGLNISGADYPIVLI